MAAQQTNCITLSELLLLKSTRSDLSVEQVSSFDHHDLFVWCLSTTAANILNFGEVRWGRKKRLASTAQWGFANSVRKSSTPKITAVQCAVLRHGEMNEKVVHRSCVRVHLSVCAERACRDLVQALCPLRRRPCDREDLANPHLRGRSQAFFPAPPDFAKI